MWPILEKTLVLRRHDGGDQDTRVTVGGVSGGQGISQVIRRPGYQWEVDQRIRIAGNNPCVKPDALINACSA